MDADKELRQFDRVNVLAPLTARPLSGVFADKCFCRLNGQTFDDSLKRNLYKRLNISGTGLAFESDAPFAQGGILEVRFSLDDVYSGVIELCIEVMRVDMRPRGYWIAGRFVGMDEAIRKLILKFIYERGQRSDRKKIAG